MQAKDGRPQIHVSALNMQCGEAFRRRYIEGEIIPPGVAMLVGTATHKSVAANLTRKIEKKLSLSTEEVADMARDSLNNEWMAGGVLLQPEEVSEGVDKVKGAAVDKAVRLSILHADSVAPGINPTHVERKWSLEIPGYPVDLVGTLDIQEGATTVRDTKTSAKTSNDDVADSSLQLTAYSLAVKVIDGRAPEKVALDYLIDTKRPIAKTFESKRDTEDYQALLARVETVSLAIEKGIFVPVSPDHWNCSPKWCGYYATCRYVHQPKQF